MHGWFRLFFALCLGLTASSADAQQYPARPITIVVPFAAGSGTDLISRLIGQQLSLALNQSVVIENKPGASGVIAATYVARAAPDGYTLLMATNSTHSANPTLFKSLSLYPVKRIRAGRARRPPRVYARGPPRDSREDAAGARCLREG